jgi:hypothetical protein
MSWPYRNDVTRLLDETLSDKAARTLGRSLALFTMTPEGGTRALGLLDAG